jgi:hypothetical protein
LARNVWSSDPGGRRIGRGKVIGAAAVWLVVIGGAVWLWWPAERVDCETLVERSQASLDQADKDLKAAGTAGVTAKCNAYRERVTVLTELAKLPAACGPPRKRPGAWPSPNDERKWYETLIFEECRP